jgi:type I restriction enzyme S subunit
MSNTSKTLNDVCEFIVDCLHATAPTQEDGYPLIRTPNIGKGRLILDGVYRVSEDTYKEWTRRAVPEANDLVLAREAPAGNVAIIKNGQQVCLGQRTVHLRPNPNQVDPDFLCYFLLTPQQQGLLLAGETGATAKHVNMKDIRRLPLKNLPGIEVQQRMGVILSTYDDLIENNRRRIALLEEAARLLYREWFVHFRFPGHEHVAIKDGVPEGWERKTLGEIAATNVESYKASTLPDIINYIDISSVEQGRITKKNTMSSSEAPGRARRKARPGDIIWSNVRPNLRAFALILDPEENDVFSTGFTVISPITVPFTYLYLFVTTDEFVGHLVNHTTGASYPAVRPEDFERAMALVPQKQMLEHFNEKAEPIYKFISVLEEEMKLLAQARDLLLPRLMNGKVAV